MVHQLEALLEFKIFINQFPMLKSVPSEYKLGDFELEMINFPIPRSEGWSYDIELCGQKLFVAKSYDDLVNVLPTSRKVEGSNPYLIPGVHEVSLNANKNDERAWKWKFRVEIPEDRESYGIEKIKCKDLLPNLEAETVVSTSRLKIVDMSGLVEYLPPQPTDETGIFKCYPAEDGMELLEGGLLVTGPKSRVVVEYQEEFSTKKILIKPLSVFSIKNVKTLVSMDKPDLTLSLPTDIRLADDQGYGQAVCTVRG